MHIQWSILPRGDVHPAHSRLYVTMNRRGEIAMNGMTYERLGSPEAFLVMFDKTNSRIALKPTRAVMKNAYPARKYGRRGARIVRAYRLLTEFGILVPDTIEFKDAEISTEGHLILDLRTAKVSPKAHSQCRKRSPKGIN